MTGQNEKPSKVSLLIADVDGSLVTEDKVLTKRARAAVKSLDAAGIAFAITSGRPPRGMAMLIEPLALRTPIAGFNGGIFVRPDLTVIEEHRLTPDAAARALKLILDHHMDAWVYCGNDWYLRDPTAPHVAREQSTVRFAPTVVSDLETVLDGAVKIVGVSDDFDLVARCEKDAQEASAPMPRRCARSLTISMSPIPTPTREPSRRRCRGCCRSPPPRSPRSATCRMTS
jgi:hydroxymethylpyrimidine pyrophosphatase-like HAD family hydrolase